MLASPLKLPWLSQPARDALGLFSTSRSTIVMGPSEHFAPLPERPERQTDVRIRHLPVR
jgi:hypothetical protein